MGETLLTYNNVELHGVHTLDFSQSAVYDESGSDLERHDFSITVRAIAHGYGEKGTDGTPWIKPVGAEAASMFAQLETSLMTPRKSLKYQVDGVTLLEVNGDVDMDGGPKPQKIQIEHLAGGRVFRVVYTINASIIKCTSPSEEGANRPPLISNRWSMEDDYDEHFAVTRRIDGRLRLAHRKHNPQAFRDFVTPRLSTGFRRKNVRFTTSMNQQELHYTFVDVREHAAPPMPAVAWEGGQTIGTAEGITANQRVWCSLRGAPGADMTQLLGAAVNVIEKRIGRLDKLLNGDGQTVVPQLITFTEKFDMAVVEMVAEVLIVPKAGGEMPLGLKNFGKSPSPEPATFPTLQSFKLGSLGGLAATFFNDACGGVRQTESNNYPAPVSSGMTDGYDLPGTQFSANVVVSLPSYSPPDYSQQQYDMPYQFFKMQSTYEFPPFQVALPICTEGNDPPTRPTLKIVRLGPRTCYRTVHIQAERSSALAKAFPEFPYPEDITADGVKCFIMDAQIVLRPPELLPGGRGKLFSGEAMYLYALETPPTKDKPLTIGANAWVKGKASDASNKYDWSKGEKGLDAIR